jgi:hypothetical protein
MSWQKWAEVGRSGKEMGRNGKKWAGMGRSRHVWEGVGRYGKEWAGMGFEGVGRSDARLPFILNVNAFRLFIFPSIVSIQNFVSPQMCAASPTQSLRGRLLTLSRKVSLS